MIIHTMMVELNVRRQNQILRFLYRIWRWIKNLFRRIMNGFKNTFSNS